MAMRLRALVRRIVAVMMPMALKVAETEASAPPAIMFEGKREVILRNADECKRTLGNEDKDKDEK
jgi:hypothetical protein